MNIALRRIFVSVCIILCAGASAYSQDATLQLRRGLDAYKQSDFRTAASVFRGVAESDVIEKADACFWLTKSLIALERYDEASAYLESFIKNFSSNPYYPEAFYERGRLLYFQKDYNSAIIAFHNFLGRYPESEYAANAYFWTGESLFALGNLESAEKMYQEVLSRYPTSARVEAARYRAAIIGQKYREEELLKLLKWSHEEYLKSLSVRASLEKTSAEIVSSYQRQIAALNTGDLHAEVIRLSEEVRVLKAELNAAQQKAAEAVSAKVSDQEFASRMTMLSTREAALKNKEAYLNQLIAEYEEKK